MTKAAQMLFMTHSGLSKSMKVLQDEMKCTLLQPAGRGLALTEDGMQFYQRAKEFLEHEERLFHTAKPQTAVSLKVGALEVFLHPITNMLKDFDLENCPVTLLDMEPGDLEKLIVSGELDYGVTYVPFPMKNLEITEIGKYHLACYHNNSKFKTLPFADIPFVVPAHGLSSNPLGIKERDGWLESLYPRRKQYQVNLLSSGLELAIQGLCAIYIPHFVAQNMNAMTAAGEKLLELALPEKMRRNEQKAFVLRRQGLPPDRHFKQLCSLVRKAIRPRHS